MTGGEEEGISKPVGGREGGRAGEKTVGFGVEMPPELLSVCVTPGKSLRLSETRSLEECVGTTYVTALL